MQEVKKKEIRENITAKVKPSIKKKAEKKAGERAHSFSRAVELGLLEYIKKPS